MEYWVLGLEYYDTLQLSTHPYLIDCVETFTLLKSRRYFSILVLNKIFVSEFAQSIGGNIFWGSFSYCTWFLLIISKFFDCIDRLKGRTLGLLRTEQNRIQSNWTSSLYRKNLNTNYTILIPLEGRGRNSGIPINCCDYFSGIGHIFMPELVKITRSFLDIISGNSSLNWEYFKYQFNSMKL